MAIPSYCPKACIRLTEQVITMALGMDIVSREVGAVRICKAWLYCVCVCVVMRLGMGSGSSRFFIVCWIL